MLELRVKQIVNVDNISQGTSWKILHNKLQESYSKEDVMLDFLGIMVHEPLTIKEFDEIFRRLFAFRYDYIFNSSSVL